MLPEITPTSFYGSVASRLGWSPALVRAIARTATPAANEDPRWLTFDVRRWKRLGGKPGMELSPTMATDNELSRRYLQLAYLETACARLDDPAERHLGILAHDFGFAQMRGDQHKFAGCDTPEAFREAMKSLEGQAHCFVAFVLASPRMLQLGRRLDLRSRQRNDVAGQSWRLGDLSEIASIWSGERRGGLDKRLAIHLDFARGDGAVDGPEHNDAREPADVLA